VVGLTFVIGVLNVCLGYALAVYLGYGPPGLPESWQALTAAAPVHEQAQAVDRVAEGLAEHPTVGAAQDVAEPVKP
jgi:hypothetical protein